MIQTYEQIFDGDSTVSAANLKTAVDAITRQITTSETPTTTNTFSILTDLALGESFDAVNPIMTVLTNSMAFASNFFANTESTDAASNGAGHRDHAFGRHSPTATRTGTSNWT